MGGVIVFEVSSRQFKAGKKNMSFGSSIIIIYLKEHVLEDIIEEELSILGLVSRDWSGCRTL